MLCFLQASGAFCDYLKLVLVLKTVESDALAAGFNPVSTGLTDSFAGCLRGVGDAEDDATDGCAIMLTTKTTKSMLMIWMTMVMDVAMLMMFTVLNSISMRVKVESVVAMMTVMMTVVRMAGAGAFFPKCWWCCRQLRQLNVDRIVASSPSPTAGRQREQQQLLLIIIITMLIGFPFSSRSSP